MKSKQVFPQDSYFDPYERLVRREIGPNLDTIEAILNDISKECETRLLNVPSIESTLTMMYVVTYDSERARKTASAIIYDEALWKLRFCYLMLCVGLLSLAHEHLRTVLDTIMRALVVGKVESEAKKFFENRDIDVSKTKRFIPADYLVQLSDIKRELNDKPYLYQLATLYGSARFDQIMAGSKKVNIPPKLPDGFLPVANHVIEQVRKVSLIFMFFMHRT